MSRLLGEKKDEVATRALVAEIKDAVVKREAAVHYLSDNRRLIL
jgi:hypothetical protein